MKRSLGFGLAVLSAVQLLGCSSDIVVFDPSRDARFRVVNVVRDVPLMDVMVEGSVVFRALAYGGSTGYLFANAGSRLVTGRSAAADSAIVFQVNAPFGAGNTYTVLPMGRAGSVQVPVLTDDVSAPPAGQAKIRAINAASSAPAVDVYVTAPGADLVAATPSFTGLGFGQISGYVPFPEALYQLRATEAGTKNVLVNTGTRSFPAGQISTFLVVENTDTAVTAPPFTWVLLGDNP